MDQLEEKRCMQYAEILGTLIRCETVSDLHDVNPEKVSAVSCTFEENLSASICQTRSGRAQWQSANALTWQKNRAVTTIDEPS